MSRLIRWLTGLVWILCLILGAGVRPAEATQATAIALSEQAGVTKVVIELSDKVEYRTFPLADPMRMVVDLSPVIWRFPTAGGALGVISGFRYGRFDANTSRLVFDLAAPARVRQSYYQNAAGQRGQRLVFEFETISREAFAAEIRPWTPFTAVVPAAAPPVTAAPAPLRPPAPTAAPAPTVLPPILPQGSANPAPSPVPPPSAPPQVASTPLPPPPPSVSAQPAPTPPPPQVAAMPPVATPRPTPAPSPRKGDVKKVIALDPGHGGVDPGAVGATGTHEKDVTLAVAREVRRQLEATGRYRVIMTRDDDSFLRLRDRVAKARLGNADLFLSLHADSMGRGDMRGASIHTLSETASDAEAAALAARENRADVIAGVDLSGENKDVASILIDLAQRETMNRSATFAGILVTELGREIQLLPTNPHRFAGFAVLKAPDIPSVLIELGYLSNRQDEMLLNRPHHRAKVASAVVKAVNAFFAAKPGGS
jgi:N-acetylmuramoyl-L-alanine amidase